LDDAHGSLLNAYAAMGRPAYPTQAQIETLRRSAQLSPPEKIPLRNGELHLTLPAQGLALIELR
jgi:beta-xylosidase